jgi:GNAT superfamily N-acetyltransferase
MMNPLQDAMQDTGTVTLHDGMAVIIRPIRPDDAGRLQALVSRLSPKSAYQRFHGARRELLNDEAVRLANVDYRTQMALVATDELSGGTDIVAVARYAVLSSEESRIAEASVVVQDDYQGHGLGTLLLMRLAEYAARHGIRVFQFIVFYSNNRMLHLIRHCGSVIKRVLKCGVYEIWVELEPNRRIHMSDNE